MNWAYGITTVPERQFSYFNRTLESLRVGGFDQPTIFVDGEGGDYSSLNLRVVRRNPKIQAFGNWMLAAVELWIRYPRADRFAIFQDDILVYKNLRQYLEHGELRPHTYWNLYTFPENEERCGGERGFYQSNQRGRGAVALVFSPQVLFKLFSSSEFIDKPREDKNPHRSIDGCICNSLIPQGVREIVHFPSLTFHHGDTSSIGNVQHQKPTSWLGEDYDAMELLQPVIGRY